MENTQPKHSGAAPAVNTPDNLTFMRHASPKVPRCEVGIYSITGEGGFTFSNGLQNPDYIVLIDGGERYLTEFASFGYEKRSALVGKTYISSDGTNLAVDVVSSKEQLHKIANSVGASLEQLWSKNNNWYVIYKSDSRSN